MPIFGSIDGTNRVYLTIESLEFLLILMSNLGLSCSLLQLKNLLKRDPDSYSEEVSYCIKVDFLAIFIL